MDWNDFSDLFKKKEVGDVAKKQNEENEEVKRQLRAELAELNAKGRANSVMHSLPVELCMTRHPMALARKLAAKFLQAEFTIVVPGTGYNDQDYKIQYRVVWIDVSPGGDCPDSEYSLRRAVEAARAQIDRLQAVPQVDSLRLYAQGCSDALGDAEKVRKELDELKSKRDENHYPRMPFPFPFFSPYWK